MSALPAWERDGADWPNRQASRFVEAGGIRWHVQQLGQGPRLLLIHGTGAATHSWRGLAPLLAQDFLVTALDLPGHGFTDPLPPARQSLDGFAAAIAALLAALDAPPDLVVGHSAGAAILARLCLDGAIAPGALVSLNGALLPLRGLAGRLFAPMARALAGGRTVPRLVARRAESGEAVGRLLRGTGSRLDASGVELYRRLLARPDHVAAVLGMMAHWDLHPLERALPGLAPRLVLVVGGHDRTVPPAEALRVRELVPSARIEWLSGLGHLAHEERPDKVAALVLAVARETGLLPEAPAP